MTATILDGKATAAAIREDLRSRVKVLAERGIVPGLGTVLVGADPACHISVAGKHRDCAEPGIASIQRELPADVSQEDVDPGVREVAGHLAPIPGGAGPMTRALLLTNVVEAAERQG